MTEIRVVPSGKIYRQMFDAQAHLSLSLHERRRKHAALTDCLSEYNPISSNIDTGSHQHQSGPNQCSEDTNRHQLFSGTKPVLSIDKDDNEVIRGLPDRVVSAKTGSDIIERFTEKKQSKHTETLTQFQRDLTELTLRYESLLRETGEDFLLKMSEYDEEVARLMQKTEHDGDLEAFSYKDLQENWNSVSHVCAMRRNCIQELNELFAKYEIERTTEIDDILRKYMKKFEKISYVMPSDVFRLINNEAMMINQALLANRRALAKLHLNLMEKDLQEEVHYHLSWETKFQDWKKIKADAAVNQFKDFMYSIEIQNSKNLQETLNHIHSKQNAYSEQRLKILEQVRYMIPPNCSTSSAAEWFSSLSSVNEQIDCLHTESMSKLHEDYENTWQDCSLKVEHFKNEVSSHGFTSEEIQDIVNREIVPLIGKCQTQAEEHLGAMEKAFEGLSMTAPFLSQSLFKFVSGAANVWEIHCAGLQRTEQQLQDYLNKIRKNSEEKTQKKQAKLDVMMDKLRQESTEEALKATFKQILNVLEEIKQGFVRFYKKGVHTVERYPVMALKEVHTYSIAVSQYFNVNEIYSQDPEELQILYPSLTLSEIEGASQTESPSGNLCTEASQEITPQSQIPDLAHDEENTDYFSQEFRDSQNNETFTTVKGNIYSCPEIECDDAAEQMNYPEVEAVLYPKSLMVELQRDVREKFFNHLEERNEEVLNKTVAIMEATKEKLKNELDLRLHLHQPRAERIKMDIHDVRAAELIMHQNHVDRHCNGILQAVADLRTDFDNLQVTQHKVHEDFCTKIYSMDTLYTATKSETLVKFGATIQTCLTEHINGIRELQRQFRKNAEHRFEGLREANATIMKTFKLLSEGGNFTLKEIEQYRKNLKKMTKCINSAHEALTLDMEVTESKYLDQAKEIINKFEEKLQFLKVDLMFLEKIQRLLSNTRVQIKSEATKCNTHKKVIDTLMSELKDMLDAYTQCSLDNRVTSDDIFGLTSSLIEELRKRSQYLDCFLDPSMAVTLPDVPLQGAFAVAAQPRFRKQEKVGNQAADPLLKPSRMGAAFIHDKAVEVIRRLQRMNKSQTCQEVSAGLKVTISATVRAPVQPHSAPGSGRDTKSSGLESLHKKSPESLNSQRRFTKPTQLEKFQVFGPKPDDQQEILTFKGLINNILWEANDLLLQVAEDFYIKKVRRLVSRPQSIQESFDLCAEDLNKRLLVYQSESHKYHHDCVEEFCKQLNTIEEIVYEIPEVLLTKLRDQHLEALSQSLTLIHQQVEHSYQQSEQKRVEHSSRLRVRLSHPACEEDLNRLVKAEDDRQEEHRKAIEKNRLELQACIKKNADDFVTALATLTENLLFQLDKILTVDEIQGGSVEQKQETILSLIRQERVGTLQEDHEKRTLLERGRRVWPGIAYFGINDGISVSRQNRETASITTAKTKMAHLKVIEVRNALHQSYEQRIMDEFERVKKFRQKHEAELFYWQEHWRGQLMILSTLNSE